MHRDRERELTAADKELPDVAPIDHAPRLPLGDDRGAAPREG